METSRKLFVLCFVLLLISCHTSKFDYKSAYKFSSYNYQKEVDHPAELPSDQLVASTRPVPDVLGRKSMDIERGGKLMPSYQFSMKDLSRVEKKALRREILNELRTMKQEAKSLKKGNLVYDNTAVKKNKKVTKEKAAKAIGGKLLIGILVGSAGLILLIVGVEIIGAIALVVGLGLIIWYFIEKGNF